MSAQHHQQYYSPSNSYPHDPGVHHSSHAHVVYVPVSYSHGAPLHPSSPSVPTSAVIAATPGSGAGAGAPAPVCRQWRRSGRCTIRGAECCYSHHHTENNRSHSHVNYQPPTSFQQPINMSSIGTAFDLMSMSGAGGAAYGSMMAVATGVSVGVSGNTNSPSMNGQFTSVGGSGTSTSAAFISSPLQSLSGYSNYASPPASSGTGASYRIVSVSVNDSGARPSSKPSSPYFAASGVQRSPSSALSANGSRSNTSPHNALLAPDSMWTPETLRGRVAHLACDVKGTRILQDLLVSLRPPGAYQQQHASALSASSSPSSPSSSSAPGPFDLLRPIVFDEILQSFVVLSCDQRGNYVCQRVLDLVDDAEWRILAWRACGVCQLPRDSETSVSPALPPFTSAASQSSTSSIQSLPPSPGSSNGVSTFAELLSHPFASRVLQKLISLVNSHAEIDFLLQHMSPHIVGAIMSQSGGRVIQECLIRFCNAPTSSPPSIDSQHCDSRELAAKAASLPADMQARAQCLIYSSIKSHCRRIACSQLGCLVLKRCFDFAPSSSIKTSLIDELMSEALNLMQHEFGNYMLQHILQCSLLTHQHVATLVHSMLPHLLSLCTQKFSSNVVERVLLLPYAFARDSIVSALASLPDSNLISLLDDRFANFVLQSAAKPLATPPSHSSHSARVALLVRLAPLIDAMRREPFSAHRQKLLVQFTSILNT